MRWTFRGKSTRELGNTSDQEVRLEPLLQPTVPLHPQVQYLQFMIPKIHAWPTIWQPRPPCWQMISLKTAHQHPNSHLLQSCLAVRGKLALRQRLRLRWAKGPATNQRARLPGQGVSPRFQSSLKTEWRRKYKCEGNCFFFC